MVNPFCYICNKIIQCLKKCRKLRMIRGEKGEPLDNEFSEI